MPSDLDEILERVARGELDPEEALVLLDDGARRPSRHAAPAPRTGAVTGGPATALRLQAGYRAIEVFADPTVAEAVAMGPHDARWEGRTLVIDNPHDGSAYGGGGDGRFSFSASATSWLRKPDWIQQRLALRVNPELPIEVQLIAGSLKLYGCRAPLKIDVAAGAAKLLDTVGPIDLTVRSGSAKAWNAMLLGESHIECESASITLGLARGNDLRMRGASRMGKLVLPGRKSNKHLEADIDERVVGKGTNHLEIDALMSSVKVTVER